MTAPCRAWAPALAGVAACFVTAAAAAQPLTPVQRAFATGVAAPWLDANITDGRLVLTPAVPWRSGPTFAEVLTAIGANELGCVPSGDVADGESIRWSSLSVEPSRSLVALPDELVDRWMVDRYGAPGRYLAPSASEWSALLGELSLCLVDEYTQTSPPTPERLPPRAACQSFGPRVATSSLRPEWTSLSLSHHPHQITLDGLVPDPEETSVWTAPTDAPMPEMLPVIATVGDQLSLAGARTDLGACVAGRCRTLGADATHSVTLDRAGLWEFRLGADTGPAARQGVVLLRMVVVDPLRDWHPSGFSDATEASGSAWFDVAADSAEVFAFVRRRQRLSTRLALDPTAAAAWNHRLAQPDSLAGLPVIDGDVPLVSTMVEAPAAAGTAALVALPTHGGACPELTARELRARMTLDPNDLTVDGEFFLHLAQFVSDDRPYRCLARARFRVWPRRALPTARRLRVGVLGDPRAIVTLTGPSALGLVVPLTYAESVLPGGFVVSTSLAGSVALGLDDAAVRRAGLVAIADVQWGVASLVSRVVGVGVLVDVFSYDDDRRPTPTVVPYASLNLGALFDRAGGR